MVIHKQSQTILVQHLKYADSFIGRLKGLILTSDLKKNAGLLITPCKQVHTHFMRYAIDVLFLDKNNQVIYIHANMRPWLFSKYIKNTQSVLELKAGSANNIRIGDILEISPRS